VVACFEPEWNSLDVNKNAFLQYIRPFLSEGETVGTVIVSNQAKRDGNGDTVGGEVFVKSTGLPPRQPLKVQQLKYRRLAGETGEQGVDRFGRKRPDRRSIVPLKAARPLHRAGRWPRHYWAQAL
jgi:hypothetical protein